MVCEKRDSFLLCWTTTTMTVFSCDSNWIQSNKVRIFFSSELSLCVCAYAFEGVQWDPHQHKSLQNKDRLEGESEKCVIFARISVSPFERKKKCAFAICQLFVPSWPFLFQAFPSLTLNSIWRKEIRESIPFCGQEIGAPLFYSSGIVGCEFRSPFNANWVFTHTNTQRHSRWQSEIEDVFLRKIKIHCEVKCLCSWMCA